MPNFKKHRFIASNDAGHTEIIDEMVKIDAAGKFYCNVPDLIHSLIPIKSSKVRAKSAAQAETFSDLLEIVQTAMDIYVRPIVTTENVICYNIESHVSFAEMPNGDITPNAVPEGAKWVDRDGRYGNHDSSGLAKGGYSLTVGAKAFTKTTTSYGEHRRTKYDLYYGDGDHLDVQCPASLLNSWCSFSLPRDAKEMPYSDDAAMFFHNLMTAISGLSRKIQDFTFDEKTLLDTIANTGGKFLLNP